MPNGRNQKTKRNLLCKIGIWWIKSSIFYLMMNKFKKYRLVILLCVLFFLLGILACQIDYEKWSPKNSSDLAAWVQAIGATVGLGIAIWLSGASYRQERRNSVIAARHFAKSMVETAVGLSCGLQDDKIGVIVLANVALSENMQSVRNIRSELLPLEAMDALVALKAIAVQISVIAKLYESKQTESNRKDFEFFLKNSAGLIDGAGRILYGSINGVPSEKFSSKEIGDRVIKSFENANRILTAAQSGGVSATQMGGKPS